MGPIFKDLNHFTTTSFNIFGSSWLMFQYKYTMHPNSFDTMFLLTSQVHKHNTHNANSFYIPQCRTNKRQFSFRYVGRTFFNSLSFHLVLLFSIVNSNIIFSMISKINFHNCDTYICILFM